MKWKYPMPKAVGGPLKVVISQYQLLLNAVREIQQKAVTTVAPEGDVTASIANNTLSISMTAGVSLPNGGLIYEVLQKNSSANGDASWGPVRAL